jgi:hypothetical protein
MRRASSRGRKFLHVANSRRRLAPAGQCFVVRLDLRERFDVGRHFFDRLSLETVTGAHLYFGLRIEDVEFRHHERIDPVDHFRVAQYRQIEPTTSSWSSRDRAEFIAALAHSLRVEIRHLGRKRTATHAGRVSLGYANHASKPRGSNTQSRCNTARSGVRRSYVGIGAVIDVEHRPLRAFEKHGFALIQRRVQ